MKEEFKCEVKRFNRKQALEYCKTQYNCSRNEFDTVIAKFCSHGKYFASVIDGYFESLMKEAEIQQQNVLEFKRKKKEKKEPLRRKIHRRAIAQRVEPKNYERFL